MSTLRLDGRRRQGRSVQLEVADLEGTVGDGTVVALDAHGALADNTSLRFDLGAANQCLLEDIDIILVRSGEGSDPQFANGTIVTKMRGSVNLPAQIRTLVPSLNVETRQARKF